LKRATPTPNRFTTFTPNWWVKGFVLFLALVFLGSCLDETSLIGVKKEPRFDLKFKEFSIPVYTVQADSLRSQNSITSNGDRLLGGQVVSPEDPRFGSITSKIFTKVRPYSLKINMTGKSNFALLKITFNLVLDYYYYGDSLTSASTFSLHEVDEGAFDDSKEYHSNDALAYNPTAIATASYSFNQDSIKNYLSYNSDANASNNVYDTLSFDIPLDSDLALLLGDSAKSRGVYSYNTTLGKDTIDYYKTDSVFHQAFNGFAIIPVSGNRVLGFKSNYSSLDASSIVKLYYSYVEGGLTKYGWYYYSLSRASSFSSISVDRSNTNLADQPGLPVGMPATSKYNNFNAPDNYCYLQAGTGLYAKLDFSAVLDTFDLIDHVAINSAELVVPLEASAVRPHLLAPGNLFLRIVKDNNRFRDTVMFSNPIYASSYYCAVNDIYYDVFDDTREGLFTLQYKTDTNGQYYRGYFTEFFEYHTRLPQSVPRVNFLALVPTNKSFGKSLDGVSFKSDQVKLRVYYTQTD
jgi:hypothetical protein